MGNKCCYKMENLKIAKIIDQCQFADRTQTGMAGYFSRNDIFFPGNVTMSMEICPSDNPLTHVPILGSSNSAA